MVNYQQSRYAYQGKTTAIPAQAEQKERYMTRIDCAAEYRYFSFTGYYFGKASFGLAQQG